MMEVATRGERKRLGLAQAESQGDVLGLLELFWNLGLQVLMYGMTIALYHTNDYPS